MVKVIPGYNKPLDDPWYKPFGYSRPRSNIRILHLWKWMIAVVK